MHDVSDNCPFTDSLSYVHNGLPMSTEGIYSNATHNALFLLITWPNVWNCAIWIDTTAINQNTTTFSLSCVIMHSERATTINNSAFRGMWTLSGCAYVCKDMPNQLQ